MIASDYDRVLFEMTSEKCQMTNGKCFSFWLPHCEASSLCWQLDREDAALAEFRSNRDFAIVRAYVGDSWGNLKFRKTAKNFSPLMCMASKR